MITLSQIIIVIILFKKNTISVIYKLLDFTKLSAADLFKFEFISFFIFMYYNYYYLIKILLL